MNNIAKIMVIVITLIILMSSIFLFSQITHDTANETSGIVTQETAPQETEPVNQGEEGTVEEIIPYGEKVYEDSDQFMMDIIKIINADDAEGLHDLMNPGWKDYLDMNQVQQALNDYKIIFKDQDIVTYRLEGAHEFAQDMIVYTLIGGNGLEKKFWVLANDDGYFASDFLIYYSEFKNYRMNMWVENLKAENIEELSMLIYRDEQGNHYPLEKTKEVLAKYKEQFDLESLTWEFTGEFGEYDEFICKIKGKKEGNNHEHLIMVLHGDGQVALVDSFVE